MEDQLVTFITAKLAKEKGFKGKIGLGYKYNAGNYYNSKGELNGSCTDYIKQIIEKTKIKNPNISAPTQSLLQKYLRDIHNIEICIRPIGNDSGKNKSYSCVLMKFSFEKGRGTFVIFQGHETRGWIYEDVLEIGLQKALKLI